MAEGKKKVIVYTDWISTFDSLTDEEAGKLIKHFFQYVNDLEPKSDRLTELLFMPIKATLKRDLESWEKKQGINRENGAKGGRPKKPTETQNNPMGFLETQNNPEKGVSVSVSVSDSVIVSEKDILLKKETKEYIAELPKKFDFKKALLQIGVIESVASDWMAVRKTKKASNTETAFNAILTEIKKTNLSPNDCITEAVARSWQGFKSQWIINQQQQNGTTTKKSLAQQAEEITARVFGYDTSQSNGNEHTNTNFEEADWRNAE